MGKKYDFLVWGTQGGGLVREVNGTFVFVEKPDCPGLDVGDEMPEEWGIIPANEQAQAEMIPDDQAAFDADLEQMYDTLFLMAEAGRVSFDEVGRFFPEDVRKRNS